MTNSKFDSKIDPIPSSRALGRLATDTPREDRARSRSSLSRPAVPAALSIDRPDGRAKTSPCLPGADLDGTGPLRVAFVSTYPPRRCGIATFTADLRHGIGGGRVVALRGPDEPGRQDHIVRHEIRTHVPTEAARAARSVNASGTEVVSLQHEYGVWGPNDGEGVLDFLGALRIPAIATLHTVLRQPSDRQRRIMQGILDGTAGVIVLSQAAKTVLLEHYAADFARVHVVPHGVPDLSPPLPDSLKPSVGLEGRQVVLSFGLLGPGKGYETVISAMPAVVSAQPDAVYVVLGATHPELIRSEGESYRTRLESLVRELGVEQHVLFVDRYVGSSELYRWLGVADIFVTPYPNLDQIVSGTLSYALAAGIATVSTPYAHALELLADGRGVLVPPEAPTLFADALIGLLADQEARAAMAERAYAYGRRMIWPRVAAEHARVLRASASTPSRLVARPAQPVVVPNA